MTSAALTKFCKEIAGKLAGLHQKGLYKEERVIFSRQGSRITVKDRKEVLNFCANNYLGLSVNFVLSRHTQPSLNAPWNVLRIEAQVSVPCASSVARKTSTLRSKTESPHFILAKPPSPTSVALTQTREFFTHC